LAGESRSFPLDEAHKQIEEQYPTSSYDKAIDDIILKLGFEKYSQAASRLRSALAACNLHLQNLKKREACEVVIWGAALPETVSEIEFFERVKQTEIKGAFQYPLVPLTERELLPLEPPSAVISKESQKSRA
jgi:hypothetical protein